MSKAYDDFMRLTHRLRAMRVTFTKVKGDYGVERDRVITENCPIMESNLVTSLCRGTDKETDGGIHQVVLDLDYDAALIPSSTPGHHHLILDVTMPWKKYVKLLMVLAECGIIEQGYAAAAISKGYSGIRPPWEKKVKEEDAA